MSDYTGLAMATGTLGVAFVLISRVARRYHDRRLSEHRSRVESFTRHEDAAREMGAFYGDPDVDRAIWLMLVGSFVGALLLAISALLFLVS